VRPGPTRRLLGGLGGILAIALLLAGCQEESLDRDLQRLWTGFDVLTDERLAEAAWNAFEHAGEGFTVPEWSPVEGVPGAVVVGEPVECRVWAEDDALLELPPEEVQPFRIRSNEREWTAKLRPWLQGETHRVSWIDRSEGNRSDPWLS